MDINSVGKSILNIIDDGGGRIPFADLKAALPYQEHRLMMPALKQLKAKGIAQVQTRARQGRPIFEAFRIDAPVPDDVPLKGGE